MGLPGRVFDARPGGGHLVGAAFTIGRNPWPAVRLTLKRALRFGSAQMATYTPAQLRHVCGLR